MCDVVILCIVHIDNIYDTYTVVDVCIIVCMYVCNYVCVTHT